MKSKPFVITVIGLAICLTALLHRQYGVFSRYNYFTAQWDQREGNIRLLDYGKRLITSSQRERVAHNMGFSVLTIAGCEISNANVNGADQYNSAMTNALNKKTGGSWETKFNKNVDFLFRLESGPRIHEAVMQQPDVRELIHKNDSLKSDNIYVRVVNLTDLDVTHPNAWLCIQKKNRVSIISYYRVNPYNLGVVHIMY